FKQKTAYEMGIDLRSAPLRAAILGAEPWSSEMGRRLETDGGLKAYDIYGLSEITGPGVASQCESQEGLHVFEDHFYPEIIDPESGCVLGPGEQGELVLTTLSKQAMPMIRYRTRDITAIMPEQCRCGRTLRRIERIATRTDDMLIVRGVNVFPSQIEAALMAIEGTLPHYQIVLTREKGLDQIKVDVEITPQFFSDRISEIEQLKGRLEQSLEQITGIRIKVNLVEMHTIERSTGKAKRVIDHRKL
ncbi:MAG TPA: phenylacetate--CoA ligase, partial [Oligoflexia bacterium]|nr:phenylacetate--CoA ligase [Oligoflexia bacterium]